MTIRLTFENFQQAPKSAEELADDDMLSGRNSEVSSIVIIHRKDTRELMFEKFPQGGSGGLVLVSRLRLSLAKVSCSVSILSRQIQEDESWLNSTTSRCKKQVCIGAISPSPSPQVEILKRQLCSDYKMKDTRVLTCENFWQVLMTRRAQRSPSAGSTGSFGTSTAT